MLLLKFAFAVTVASTLSFAESVPADLSVDAFTAKTMKNAVRQALGAKPATDTRAFTLNFADDKELRRALTAMASQPTRECAIPLLEVKGGNGRHAIDPFAKPTGKTYFDSIGRPASVGPCPFRPDFSK